MILGIDEVGRGSWAGPLVACAVSLKYAIEELRDSKQLTFKKREALSQQIKKAANAYSLGWVEAKEIDELGLTAAVKTAMERALSGININYSRLIIDGNYNYLSRNKRAVTLIKADQIIPDVSAASILAKVARDNYMIKMAIKYPGYGFEKHVGYGTLLHAQRLFELGVSPIHRRSFKPISVLNEK